MKEAKVIKPSSASLSNFHLPNLHILIAEDNEINQKLLQKQLLGFGIQANQLWQTVLKQLNVLIKNRMI